MHTVCRELELKLSILEGGKWPVTSARQVLSDILNVVSKENSNGLSGN
jgi:hypothetical protein